METRLLLILGAAALGALSSFSKYQFREDHYFNREEYIEERWKSVRRRMFLFAFVVLVLTNP